MSLIKFNPNTPVWDSFDSIFNDFFEGEFLPRKIARTASLPAANVKETEKAYHVELAAPGMKKEDFKVEVNEDLLSIRAERKEEKESTEERFTKREFNYTSFVRSFRLPENVKAEDIEATYKDGILALEIPKLKIEEKPKVREISIK
jgi:HSP20 family protein